MGSIGTGRLTDYSGAKKQKQPKTKPGSDKGGGSSGHDPCADSFTAKLEDVARAQYYASNGSLPPNGTDVKVKLAGRLVVYGTGGDLGFLPTHYNYLAGCMNRGFSYGGKVVSSATTPIPTITVDIAPI